MANAQHLAWLSDGVEAWNARRAREPFRPDLRDADLSGAALPTADFHKADLTGARFDGAVLDGADFFAATLARAHFVRAQLEGCEFERAEADGADFSEASASYADFGDASLLSARFVGAHLAYVRFAAANLSRADLSGSRLTGVVFAGATLVETRFDGAHVRTVTVVQGDDIVVDLSSSDVLKQAQVDAMDGDRGVILPRQVSFPAGWPPHPGEAAERSRRDPPATVEAKARLAVAHPALTLAARSVIDQIARFRETVRSDNRLAVEHPEFRDRLLDFLDRLAASLGALIDGLPDPGEALSDAAAECALSWRDRFRAGLAVELDAYAAPEAMAKTAVPAGLIFGLGAIGALLGGPIGFGAGAMAGQILVGHAKPGAAAARIEKTMDRSPDPPAAD